MYGCMHRKRKARVKQLDRFQTLRFVPVILLWHGRSATTLGWNCLMSTRKPQRTSESQWYPSIWAAESLRMLMCIGYVWGFLFFTVYDQFHRERCLWLPHTLSLMHFANPSSIPWYPKTVSIFWIRYSYLQWRYCIRLENLGELTVQLRERHWRIFSLSGTLETVRGRGVVGQEPVLSNQQPAFQYSSHVSLQAPSGHMWWVLSHLRTNHQV